MARVALEGLGNQLPGMEPGRVAVEALGKQLPGNQDLGMKPGRRRPERANHRAGPAASPWRLSATSFPATRI